MNLREKGFTLVEGLLAGVVILLIVGVGFYVYSANKEQERNNSEEQKSVVERKEELSQNPNQAQTKESARKLLEIKELGITLDLNDAPYDDITYTMTSNKTAAVYSKGLHQELLNACGQMCAGQPYSLNLVVDVYYYDSTNNQYGDAPIPIEPGSKNANSKLFAGFTGPSDPAGDNLDLSNRWIDFRDYIKKTIEKI